MQAECAACARHLCCKSSRTSISKALAHLINDLENVVGHFRAPQCTVQEYSAAGANGIQDSANLLPAHSIQRAICTLATCPHKASAGKPTGKSPNKKEHRKKAFNGLTYSRNYSENPGGACMLSSAVCEQVPAECHAEAKFCC